MTRVLIVEDEPIIAMSLQQLLEDHGFSVLACVDSELAAVAAVQQERPDIALVDLRLRGDASDATETAASGLRLAEELWVCDRVPVVFVTAFPDLITQQTADNTGAFGVVAKPYGSDALVAAVNIAARRARDVLARGRP